MIRLGHKSEKHLSAYGNNAGWLNPLQRRVLTLVTDRARRADGLHFIRIDNGWLFSALRRGRPPHAGVCWRIEDFFRNLIASGEN